MPYFIYARDGKTGEPAKRLFSDAISEDTARAEAENVGLQVTSIVACREEQRPDAAPPARTSATMRVDDSADSMEGAQREAIKGIALYMKIVGIVMILFAALLIAATVYAKSAVLGIQGLTVLGLSSLTVITANKFRGVHAGYGHPRLLTEALQSLRLLYFVQVVLFGIGAVMIVIGLIGLAVMFAQR